AEHFRVPVLDVASHSGMALFDALGVVTLRCESLLLYLALQLPERFAPGVLQLLKFQPKGVRPTGIPRPQRGPIELFQIGKLSAHCVNAPETRKMSLAEPLFLVKRILAVLQRATLFCDLLGFAGVVGLHQEGAFQRSRDAVFRSRVLDLGFRFAIVIGIVIATRGGLRLLSFIGVRLALSK